MLEPLQLGTLTLAYSVPALLVALITSLLLGALLRGSARPSRAAHAKALHALALAEEESLSAQQALQAAHSELHNATALAREAEARLRNFEAQRACELKAAEEQRTFELRASEEQRCVDASLRAERVWRAQAMLAAPPPVPRLPPTDLPPAALPSILVDAPSCDSQCPACCWRGGLHMRLQEALRAAEDAAAALEAVEHAQQAAERSAREAEARARLAEARLGEALALAHSREAAGERDRRDKLLHDSEAAAALQEEARARDAAECSARDAVLRAEKAEARLAEALARETARAVEEGRQREIKNLRDAESRSLSTNYVEAAQDTVMASSETGGVHSKNESEASTLPPTPRAVDYTTESTESM